MAEVPQGLDAYPEFGRTVGKTCHAVDPARFVGKVATGAMGTQARDAAGAALVRWIRPGALVTTDYRWDRLNITLDAQNRIVSLSCG